MLQYPSSTNEACKSNKHTLNIIFKSCIIYLFIYYNSISMPNSGWQWDAFKPQDDDS